MKNRLGVAIFVLLLAAGCGEMQPPKQAHAEPGALLSEAFPYVIAFEQGATQFQPGDLITITEVRGTSSDMSGGIYRISGTYTLASRDSATLAAFVSASSAADGRSPVNSAQTLNVTRGSGPFTLMLPISIKGYPHVSFYADSNAIGGVYFGTGDSVLRR